MNYQEFVGYLKNTTDKETLDLIDEIDDLLTNYNLTDYLLQMDDVIFTDSQSSDQDITDTVIETFNQILEQILNSHGIVIVEDSLLSEKLSLCQGLLDIQDYEDKQKITELVSLDISSEEILSELLSLVTSFEVEKILTLLSSVNDNLISIIKTTIKVPEEIDEQSEIINKRLELYENFKRKIDYKPIYSDLFIQNTANIDLQFILYFNMYLSYVKTLETLDPEIISLDLIGMSILSCDEELGVNLIKDNISKISSDLNFISRVTTLVTNNI